MSRLDAAESYTEAMRGAVNGIRIVLVLMLVVVGFIYWNMTWSQRPSHSVVYYPYLLKDGNIEINLQLGKSGMPRLLLAEVPSEQLSWGANYYVDDSKYAIQLSGQQLVMGNFSYTIRKEIKLPKEPPWWLECVTRQSQRIRALPEGGPKSYYGWSAQSAVGDWAVSEYQIDSQLRKLAASGHLVAAAIDPDGTIRRVVSFKQLDRDG